MTGEGPSESLEGLPHHCMTALLRAVFKPITSASPGSSLKTQNRPRLGLSANRAQESMF